MITLNEININKIEDYESLAKYIDKQYIHIRFIKELKGRIGCNCNKIYIEYPYYDSDYLSTYYSFYIKKHREYSKKCYRLHLLKDDEYLGYVTLRPTISNTKVGKSYISPQLLLNTKAYLILADFKLHLLGLKSFVKAFPWMYQETDISVCAHVATWSIVRYFGNKYKNYIDIRMSDIIESTPDYINRKIPSKGLNLVQITDILREYGFYPLLIQKNPLNKNEFYDELIAYIESGIPLVAAMTGKGHAISISGHGQVDYAKISSINDDTILSARLINSIFVNDDNYFPYVEIFKSNSSNIVKYSMEDIDYVIAPLYDRMQLGYRSVVRRITDLIKYTNYDFKGKKVVRIYMTSSNSLKKNALTSNNMNDDLKAIIINLCMPKFIWCVDISTEDEYINGLTSGRIIIDTTAGTYEEEPWLLIHDTKKIVYLDEEFWKSKSVNVSAYDMYINNLVEV
ncbi:hypothetical protein ACJDU8_02295 [Clostridium sp. WILCCON 0269]|uniref:GNAT family N-acetyltransferase n=1 Tax=Candidatus Clostridium eludens TaxID=3381663 RepID=A0ABW8SGW0_9CLOT